MKPRKLSSVVFLAILSVGIILFSGCALTEMKFYSPLGTRFYSGAPRQASEIAIVVLDQSCYLRILSEGGASKKRLDPGRASYIYEIQPGNYTLCVIYRSMGKTSSSYSAGCIELGLNAQAGHVYHIYPRLWGGKHWKPFLTDFRNDDDYVKTEYGRKIQAKVKKYLKGKRSPMTQLKNGDWQ